MVSISHCGCDDLGSIPRLDRDHQSTIGLVVKFNVAIVEPRVRFSDGAADSQSLPRSLNGFMDADVMPDDVALPRRGVG